MYGCTKYIPEWYRNVTEQLQRIPDSAERYKPTCTAILQLQVNPACVCNTFTFTFSVCVILSLSLSVCVCNLSPYVHFPFQELLEEARQGQPEGAWPAEDPFVAIAAKQERLFSALTEFHRRDLEVLEGKIAAISSQVDSGTQLHELQVHTP